MPFQFYEAPEPPRKQCFLKLNSILVNQTASVPDSLRRTDRVKLGYDQDSNKIAILPTDENSKSTFRVKRGERQLSIPAKAFLDKFGLYGKRLDGTVAEEGEMAVLTLEDDSASLADSPRRRGRRKAQASA